MLKFNINQTKLYRPPPNSHKGQNGKLLVIGGSKLFHSSIFWSADVASKIVDVVHFASPANENNEVVRKRIKEGFWSGIVVEWGDVEKYIEEDDCVLIGPGMIRSEAAQVQSAKCKVQSADNESTDDLPVEVLTKSGQFPRKKISSSLLSTWGAEDKTKQIIDYLLKKYPTKRWVIDGGALQEVEPELITQNCILTPHRREFEQLMEKTEKASIGGGSEARIVERQASSVADDKRQSHHDTGFATATASHYFHNATILLKGPTDTVCQADRCVEISGGNPGMTKGGTGDVLAGLVAALYCKNDSWTAATVGSWVNKQAGDMLYKRVGPYFNATDFLGEVPKILGKLTSGK